MKKILISLLALFCISIPLLIIWDNNEYENILYGSNNYGIPGLVMIYISIGFGIIVIENILLQFGVIKSLPLSQYRQINIFFIGLVIIYGIAFYYGYSNPSLSK